jgi:glycerate-2-kinase
LLGRLVRFAMTARLRDDALAISRQWLDDLDLASLIEARMSPDGDGGGVDLVSIGKASHEMAAAAREALGDRVRRQFIVVDRGQLVGDGANMEPDEVLGDHPVPGPASREAGERLVTFLDGPSTADETLFLVSGGASSLCVVPAAPLTIDDLAQLWDAALVAGIDITLLNQLRASTSLISGGGGAAIRSHPLVTDVGDGGQRGLGSALRGFGADLRLHTVTR